MTKIIDRLSTRFDDAGKPKTPKVGSFVEFLENHAKAKLPGGSYAQYSFKGREALKFCAEIFDHVLGSHTGKPIPDSRVDICGGAQFGKTILGLNFGAYVTTCPFFNWGYYLPDDDLVEGIVDSKLRPDVIEQIDWLPPLMTVGKGEDKKGKVVNRKGAFMVTDGVRKAFGYIRGMGKIPTSFSMDVAMEDEKDDINAGRSKYLKGRMTASELRLSSSIGTQRVHGAGQNKQLEAGSKHVFVFPVTDAGKEIVRASYDAIRKAAIVGEPCPVDIGPAINLEDLWPQVCRLQLGDEPSATDPMMSEAGDFRRLMDDGENYEKFENLPGLTSYLADPKTGAVIDRSFPVPVAENPEKIKHRQWSVRIAQLTIGAAPLGQILSRWGDAVKDPELMNVFRCDVLAIPQSTTQAITPAIIQRSRECGEPFDFRQSVTPGAVAVAGLDTGNRCWFVAREILSASEKRLIWAEEIPLGDVVPRTIALYNRIGLSCLLMDANPAVDQVRSICYALHGLTDYEWPHIDNPDKQFISFPGGLTWDGEKKRWQGLKAAAVQFDKKPGQGIEHKLGREQREGKTWFFPIISCNRFETIDRTIKELLTPSENVTRVVDGEILMDPVLRMPRQVTGSPVSVETLASHYITGSKRAEDAEGNPADYVDKCENHFLLGGAYAALAEETGGINSSRRAFAWQSPGRREKYRMRRGGTLI